MRHFSRDVCSILRKKVSILFFLIFAGYGSCVFGTNNATAVIVGTDPFYGRNEQPLITASSVGGGSSSTSGGVGTSTSQLGTITGLAQVGYQTGEVNLTTGGLGFSETDLVLPGKNGLDLSITRSYSSSRYQTEPNLNPTEQKALGMYAGKGWAFNIGMRVFVVRSNDSKNIDKVFVETADGIEEYENGVSKQPGNFNKTSVITSGGKMDPITEVQFKTTSGRLFVFSKQFYKESYTKFQDSRNSDTQYKIEGYYLSRIQDLSGNSIQFNYQDLSGGINVPVQKLGPIIGQGNIDYIKNNGYELSINPNILG